MKYAGAPGSPASPNQRPAGGAAPGKAAAPATAAAPAPRKGLKQLEREFEAKVLRKPAARPAQAAARPRPRAGVLQPPTAPTAPAKRAGADPNWEPPPPPLQARPKPRRPAPAAAEAAAAAAAPPPQAAPPPARPAARLQAPPAAPEAPPAVDVPAPEPLEKKPVRAAAAAAAEAAPAPPKPPAAAAAAPAEPAPKPPVELAGPPQGRAAAPVEAEEEAEAEVGERAPAAAAAPEPDAVTAAPQPASPLAPAPEPVAAAPRPQLAKPAGQAGVGEERALAAGPPEPPAEEATAPKEPDSIVENLDNIMNAVENFQTEILHDIEMAREAMAAGTSLELPVKAATTSGLVLGFENGLTGFLPFWFIRGDLRKRLELERMARVDELEGRPGGGAGEGGAEGEGTGDRRWAIGEARKKVLETLVGTTFEVCVYDLDLAGRIRPNRIQVVLADERLQQDIKHAEAMFREKMPATFTVVDAAETGVNIDFGNGLNGFLPHKLMSQTTKAELAERARQIAAANDQAGVVQDRREVQEKALGILVDREMSLSISHFQETKMSTLHSVIMSEAAAQHYWRDHAGELIQQVAVDDVVAGVVQNVKPYGIFVDVSLEQGIVRGLIHRSEISWEKNSVIAQFRVGAPVEAKVLEINTEKNTLALSIKRMTPDPITQTFHDLIHSQSSEQESLTEAPAIEEFLAICKELETVDCISCVVLSPCTHSATFAQSLQVFLSTRDVAEGYEVICRRGLLLQSAVLHTLEDRERIKAVLMEKLQAAE